MDMIYGLIVARRVESIFVIDGQLLHELNWNLMKISNGKSCPTCGSALDINLLKYPENVFYERCLPTQL